MSKVLFKELPISKRKLKGSLETLGQIDYHYQKYDNTFKTTLQNRQLGTRKYEWWKDEETYLDIDK